MIFYEGGKPVRKRGFEVISKYKDQNINLPQRATHHAAGYDFEAAEEVVIPSIWKAGWKKGLETVADGLKKMYQKMKTIETNPRAYWNQSLHGRR